MCDKSDGPIFFSNVDAFQYVEETSFLSFLKESDIQTVNSAFFIFLY